MGDPAGRRRVRRRRGAPPGDPGRDAHRHAPGRLSPTARPRAPRPQRRRGTRPGPGRDRAPSSTAGPGSRRSALRRSGPAATSTSRCRCASAAACSRTRAPSSPSRSGTTTSAGASATRPYAVSEWCDTPRCRSRWSAPETRSEATGRPPSDARRVHRLAGRDAGEPPPRPGAEVAGTLRDDDEVGADDVPGREQARVHGDRLEVAAERLPGGDARLEPPGGAQAGDRPGEPRGQRAPVGHHVRDPRHRPAGTVGGEPGTGDDRGQRRVQVRHHDGQAGEVVGVAQELVVRRLLVVDAQDHRLQRGVARLDQVTRSGRRVGGCAVGQRDHERVAAGAEPAGQGGDVEQDPVADLRAADQRPGRRARGRCRRRSPCRRGSPARPSPRRRRATWPRATPRHPHAT